MRIHVLQHVPFEGPAAIAHWAEARGHSLAVSHLYAGDPPPDLDSFDRLVIMGGPMSVVDEAEHSWLEHEKARIEESIHSGKSVVGICLGAQLLAEALGARVSRNPHKEIGWLPVTLTEAARAHPLCADLPMTQQVFQWHGDTFELPDGAVHLASSEACEQQAFLYENRLLGLQFHLESTPESVDALCEHCADELFPGPYVQTAEQMRAAEPARHAAMHATLAALLDRLSE
jgi:GMP synthase-like glutamine amidotransferase